MSAVIVDTSIWIEYFRGTEYPEVDRALREGRVHLPPLVASELSSGKMSPKLRTELRRFLGQLPLVPTDLSHWVAAGELRRKLAEKGLTLSTPDAHIAQCAIELRGELLTLDRVFRSVARVVDLRLLR